MKKTILILIIGLFPILSFSQARLGSSAQEIKSEYWESKYNVESGYNDDEIYYVSLETDRASVVHFFNNDKICVMSIIAPDNQGALNFYVENYNNQYVIVSSTEWKMYSKNGIAKIKLIYPDDGGFYFVWTGEE